MKLLVFYGARFYPSGGFEDYIGSAGAVEDAYNLLKIKVDKENYYAGWFQIVNEEKIVASGDIGKESYESDRIIIEYNEGVLHPYKCWSNLFIEGELP